jgi:transposase
VVLVADRGLLSLENLQSVGEIKIGERPLEFILAVPARRYGDFEDILGAFHRTTCSQAAEEVTGEFRWQDYRLIVAHRPDLAREQGRRREEQIAALQEDAARWTGKLNEQDEGKRYRGRKLSDGGVTARFYKAVSDARLAHILKVDLASDVFCYDVDERALNRARMLDGKLILVTNMADHGPKQIVQRYKALADIERGFRVLKSEIEIAPVFHRRADRIRAHALICFLALVLYRVLRMRLQDRNSPCSPERVLEIMRRIQFHQVTLHQNQTASGLSTLTPEQCDLFDTIDLVKPSANQL